MVSGDHYQVLGGQFGSIKITTQYWGVGRGQFGSVVDFLHLGQ